LKSDDIEALKKAALDYHELPTPGKLSITATKQLLNQSDLALAYSPGVAAACEAIVADPLNVFRYTARGNLVGVVTNGTAVLGLGAIGPLAAKPVMEGKAVLFKKFAGIDVFDIEIEQRDPQKLIEVIAALEPTFGAINLEDIKAPECFIVERELRRRMKIPVFHDDQHGTAIIVGAACLNGLQVVGKALKDIKLAVSGAGDAALACVDLLLELGLVREHVWLTDLAGVVYEGRQELMDPEKARFAQPTAARTLDEVIQDADVFLGLSAGGVLTAGMVAKMAPRPLILALANPTPEILPEEVRAVRADAVIATGRSDYPNQVNNVLCFPFIFRGALMWARPPSRGRWKSRRCTPSRSWPVRSRAMSWPPMEASRTLHSVRNTSSPSPSIPLDRQDRAGSRQGGHAVRSGDSADRRSRRVRPAVAAVRVSQRHSDAADICRSAPGARGAQPDCLRRRRGRRVLRAVQIAVDESSRPRS
jgi:malic enzyme